MPFPLIDNDYNFVLPLKWAKMINTKKLKYNNNHDDSNTDNDNEQQQQKIVSPKIM